MAGCQDQPVALDLSQLFVPVFPRGEIGPAEVPVGEAEVRRIVRDELRSVSVWRLLRVKLWSLVGSVGAGCRG